MDDKLFLLINELAEKHKLSLDDYEYLIYTRCRDAAYMLAYLA